MNWTLLVLCIIVDTKCLSTVDDRRSGFDAYFLSWSGLLIGVLASVFDNTSFNSGSCNNHCKKPRENNTIPDFYIINPAKGHNEEEFCGFYYFLSTNDFNTFSLSTYSKR